MSTVGPKLLARLAREHGAALVLYAQQLCQTPEDVVQEAFLQLARQQETPENVVGWLYRVVRNGAISASRSAARRKRHESAAADSESWFEKSEGHLDAATVAEALAGMPDHERETIVARLWGGMSFEAVAELTGVSTSTAFRRYAAGLEALRERLGVACPERSSPRTLKSLESKLAALVPRGDRLDRNELLFRTGQLSAGSPPEVPRPRHRGNKKTPQTTRPPR